MGDARLPMATPFLSPGRRQGRLSVPMVSTQGQDGSRRVGLVLRVRGASLSHLPSSHINEPHEQDKWPCEMFDVWTGEMIPFTTEEEDQDGSWARQYGESGSGCWQREYG